MSAIVVYESVYGNTRAVAEAIAEGLGDALLTPVHEAPGQVGGYELLVVGGPTHMHGMATRSSRQAAVDAVQEDGNAHEIGDGTVPEALVEKAYLAKANCPELAIEVTET